MAKYKDKLAHVSKILDCDCTNRTQDRKHGQGKRLHYKCAVGWRCSSCKKEKDTRKPKKEEVKADAVDSGNEALPANRPPRTGRSRRSTPATLRGASRTE